MSVVALSDLLFGDLLTETNMKPWWEKMRGYIFAGTVAFALSVTYLTLNGMTLNCLPIENGNVSYTCEYGLRQAAWMNSYCSNRLPWFINYFGSLCLATALILLFVSSYWLHKPKVIDSFVTFVDLEKKVSELNMTTDELLKSSCQPLQKDVKDEKHLKLREVCDELWKGGRNLELKSTYSRRNVLLITCSIIAAIFFIVILGLMIDAGDRFYCELHDEDKALILGRHIFPTEFVCVAQMAYRLIAFNAVFVASILMQIAPIFWGWHKMDKQKERLTNNTNIDFMRFFWKYARPTQSKKFSRLLKHVCGNTASDAIRKNLSDAIEMEDFVLVRTFVSLPSCKYESAQQEATRKQECGILLIKTIMEMYRTVLQDCPKNISLYANSIMELDRIEKTIIEVCECLPNETPVENYEELLTLSRNHRRWKMMANILHQFVTKHSVTEGYSLINKLSLDYDILDGEYQSFLSHAVDEHFKSSLYPILKRLNKKYLGEYKLFVHENGKSFLLSAKVNFFEVEDSVETTEGGQIPNVTECFVTFQSILRECRGNYLELDKFNERLSKFKFQKWCKEAKDMAKEAFEDLTTRNSTFVYLLNCYVVPENSRNEITPLNCDIYDADDIDFNQVLQNSQARQPHDKIFVPTAARHIISCLSTEKRTGCIQKVRASNLDNENKKALITFIQKCNANNDDFPKKLKGERSNEVDETSVIETSSQTSIISPQDGAAPQKNDQSDVRISIDAQSSNEGRPLLDEHSS